MSFTLNQLLLFIITWSDYFTFLSHYDIWHHRVSSSSFAVAFSLFRCHGAVLHKFSLSALEMLILAWAICTDCIWQQSEYDSHNSIRVGIATFINLMPLHVNNPLTVVRFTYRMCHFLLRATEAMKASLLCQANLFSSRCCGDLLLSGLTVPWSGVIGRSWCVEILFYCFNWLALKWWWDAVECANEGYAPMHSNQRNWAGVKLLNTSFLQPILSLHSLPNYNYCNNCALS